MPPAPQKELKPPLAPPPEVSLAPELSTPAFFPETQVPEARPTPPAEVQSEQLPPREGETVPARKEGFMEESIDSLKQKLHLSKKPKPTAIPVFKDQTTIQIEHLMEAGLADAYKELTPVQRQEFKIKGEQTAMTIREILRATKVKFKKIVRLILEWLRLLPGINKFFLEQEAKIKADRIIALKNSTNIKQG